MLFLLLSEFLIFFRRFLGEGALSISFIPVFIQCLSGNAQGESEQRARNFMNSVYTILLVCISVLTVLGIVFMDPLLRSLFAGTSFSEVEGKVQMAIVMARILFIYYSWLFYMLISWVWPML